MVPDPKRMRDVIIVGGGLAGLTAAYRLRERDILVVEGAARAGGRVMSVDDDGLPLNLGAHMFSGPGTPVGDLVAALGLSRQPIQGRLMAMAMGGRLFTQRPELWPLLLPLTPLARASFVQMGLRLRWGAARMAAAMAHGPALGHEDHRTLARFIGPLHPQAAMILDAITERSAGDPAVMSAGHALRSFTNVWSGKAPGANLAGGSGRLIDALVAAVDPARVVTDAPVKRVRTHPDHVAVTLAETTLRAKRCIVATPAPVTRALVADLPDDTNAALKQIRYGTFLAVALAVRGDAPWRGSYAISTPGAAFSVLFDQGTGLDTGARSSLMLFRGAAQAAEMATQDDDALAALARRYLHEHFPKASFQIEAIHVARWHHGAPVSHPGRAALQPALLRNLGRIALAGDYLESPNMGAAISSADHAVAMTLAALAEGQGA